MDVASSASSASRDHQPFAWRKQLAQDRRPLGVRRTLFAWSQARHGPRWHREEDVGGVLAVRLPTRAMPARLGPVMRVMAQVAQRGQPGVDDEHDRSTGAAVAAIGPSAWDVGLSPEGGGTVAPGAARHQDADLVSEHRRPMIAMGSGRPGARREG